MSGKTREISPADWDRTLEEFTRRYRDGSPVDDQPESPRILELTVYAWQEDRELELKLSDGTVNRYVCEWREYMK